MTNEVKPKKPIWKKPWFWIIAIFVIIIIASSGGGEKKETKTPESTQPVYQYEQGTPERVIEEKFIQILGKKTNMEEKRLRQVTIYADIYINNYQNVDIEYIADENLTTGLTRSGIWRDAQRVLKDLPAVLEPQVMTITLKPHLKLVDQYGKEAIKRVMTIRITRETWEKINWDNFIYDNIPIIAETYWAHPVLSK